MTRNDVLFGTPERSAATLMAMGCRNPDEYVGCEGCPFFADRYGPCPQVPNGIRRMGDDGEACTLEEWLGGEVE